MNIEELREYCLSKKGTTESFPFDKVTLVFKVGSKMFALVNIDGDHGVNLKCDPEEAINIREHYPAVQPGYHMSKKHWITVELDGTINKETICKWIDNSYDLVVAKMTKKERSQIENL